MVKMKSFYKLLLLLFVSMPILAYSQKHIENAYIRASYEFFYKTNPKQTVFTKTDLINGEVIPNSSRSTSYVNMTEVIPGTVGESMLEAVCNSN